ncbi:hypothetical protein Ocin01_00848 [Orchesella cincta]|uniref:Transmembrane protein n=1 Tax=Orchesella cincta TaxID=48709 RepID=A0A1D2NKT5_ORCCI|nr:hypothetical protein Ocin01_00848 [Orchesella cincta]
MQITLSPSFCIFSKCIRAKSVSSIIGTNFRFSSSFTKPYHHTSLIRRTAIQLHQSKPSNILVRKPNTLIELQYRPPSLKLFVRSKTTESKEFCGTKTLARYYRRDGVPNTYKLIYRSNFPGYLLTAQAGVFITLVALIAVGITYAIQVVTYDEDDERARKDELHKLYEERRTRENESEFVKAVQNIREERGWTNSSAKGPQMEDLVEGGPAVFGFFIFTLVTFAAALFRLQQLVPVRLYVNNKNKHSVAIYFGHLIPGKLTHQEFLAGTVRPAKSRMDSGTLFMDGSGKKMMLFERFFRSPADYNMVMGYDEEFMQEVVQERQRKPRITSGSSTDGKK